MGINPKVKVMPNSPKQSDDVADVLVLHEVLRAELGDWKPGSGEDVTSLAEYENFAGKARNARALWTKFYNRKANRSQGERACEEMLAAEKRCLVPLYRILNGQERSALCLSGGGIRSATFSLGIIHALAKYSFQGEPALEPARLLAEFDYLSTVSGGGYIGSWFSSWIHHAGSTDEVVRQLARTPTDKLDPEPKPLLHLRDYSNYLNPRLGLFSADTWTLVATTIRNILLNWLVLIPFLAAALLLPDLFQKLVAANPVTIPGHGLPFLMAGFAAAVLGTAFIMYNLPSFGGGKNGEGPFLLFCLTPLTLSAACLTLWWGWHHDAEVIRDFSHWVFFLFGAAIHGLGVLGGVALSLSFKSPNFQKGHFQGKRLTQAFIFAIITGGLGAWLFSFIAVRFHPAFIGPLLYACLGVPLVFAALAAVGVLAVGASSKITEDDDREWWSRAGAWVLIVGTAWVLLSSLVLLLPAWLGKLSWQWSLSFSTVSGVLGWFVSQAGANDKSGPDARGDQSVKGGTYNKIHALLLPAAAVLFLIALVCGVVLLNRWLVGFLGAVGSFLIFLELGLAVWISYTVNVNKFSLHAMYRMRLVRAYLAASKTEQSPNPFTGFDLQDNVPMQHLSSEKPMHVLNLCLNLVRGSKLAWQQRKAESFTVTRLHAGSFRVGYQSSTTYGQGPSGDGISLGTAMTISGAAASPNMGYHSSPLTALVMTLFNARLGWWLANPGEPGRNFWEKNGPAFGIRPILDEAFGNTTDANRYVYLSDGGHFENLGLYEMVLRRCRFIVVVDAGADPNYAKEDLGNAVRKIRIDLGVPIEFPEFPEGIPADSKLGSRAKHCALGEILYDCVDEGARNGYLLYIKPLLTGDEPADVLHYHTANLDFPQQSTADQWFDESQFESYRRLGAHTIETILGTEKKAYSIEELFNAARIYLGLDALNTTGV